MKLTRAQKIAIEAFLGKANENLDFYENIREAGLVRDEIEDLAHKIENAMHEELNERYLLYVDGVGRDSF